MSASDAKEPSPDPQTPTTSSSDPARMNLLLDVLLRVAGSNDREALVREFASQLSWVLDFEQCCLGLIHPDGTTSYHRSPVHAPDSPATDVSSADREVMARAMRERRSQRNEEPESGIVALCLPLEIGERAAGAVLLRARGSTAFGRSEVRFAQAAAAFLALALDRLGRIEALARSNEELRFAHLAAAPSRVAPEASPERDVRGAIVRELEETTQGFLATKSFEEALHELALQSRLMVAAHQVAISFVPDGDFKAATHTTSLSEKYAQYDTYDVMPTGEGIWGLVVKQRQAVRMTQEELANHPMWKNFSDLKDSRGLEHPPMRGWLAIPILQDDGRLLGVLQASDKYDGEFDENDLQLFQRLGRMISRSFSLQAANEEIQRHSAELAQAKEALERSNAELQELADKLANEQYLLNSLVESIPDPVFFKDRDCRFMRVNQVMAVDAGMESPEDFIGKTDLEVWSGKFGEDTLADERRILETGEPLINKEENPINRHGEERWVLVTKMPLRDETGEITGTFGIARDITTRKKNEDAIRRANADLARSNADLEQFAYVASHDLQEPLRAVAGYCQLLERRYVGALDEQGDTYLQHVVEGAQRMQQLIDDLLQYSRVSRKRDEFEPTDLRDAVEQAKLMMKTPIEQSGATIHCESLPVVMADRAQQVQLFQNLISNAIKYRGDEPPAVVISAEDRDGEVVISVCDNGIGIEPEFFDRIFVIFKRLHTRDEYAGTGIGLAVCKRIVDRHRGRIWVESEPGQGCDFRFTIPSTKDAK
jgi:PAS domain S-box-containing protein